MIYSQGLGGVRVWGLGGLSSRAKSEYSNAPSSADTAEDRQTHLNDASGVTAGGADLKGLIRWVFFVVIAIAVVTSLINISQFAMINRELADVESGLGVDPLILRSILISAAMSLVTIAAGFAAARLLSRLIADSLKELSDLTGKVAEGREVEHVGPSGPVGIELARIYHGLRIFYANMREVTALRAQESETRQRHDREIRERIEAITTTMRKRIEELTETVATEQQRIVEDSRVVRELVETVRTTSSDSIISVGEARSKLDTSAADLSQLVEQVELISRKAAHTDTVSDAAVADARAGEREVQSLEADAQSIGTVVSQIQDLASRIDLLAVNAAIEAARAGNAGAGFAVVAKEVKQLSMQTSQATEEIRTRIQTIREAVPRSATAYRQIFERLEEISANADDSASSVQRQEDSARRISDHAGEVGSEIRSVAERMNSLASETEEAVKVANRLQEAAGRTSEVIDDMRTSLIRELESINEHTATDSAERSTGASI